MLSLSPYDSYRKGEPRFPGSKTGNNLLHDQGGLKFDVSSCDSDDSAGQIREAIAFLDLHRLDLQLLRGAEGVDLMYLDTGINYRLGREDWFVHCDFFPPKLVSLAGGLGLGIEASIYPADGDS